MMRDSSFPKANHVRKSPDFERVYAGRHKAADGVLLVFVNRNNLNRTRIGLSVGRKHGGAVVRNRIKRLLREAFRLEQSQLPVGIDLIAVPLAAEAASLAAYRKSIPNIVRRVMKRLDSTDSKSEPMP